MSESVSNDLVPEGCTPADAAVLRAANHNLVAESHALQSVLADLLLQINSFIWVPAHERVPACGTECVVLVRYALDRPPFRTVDTWDVQREDPTGMGGPTIVTGEGWNDHYEADVIAWIAIPPHPPAEWDQRFLQQAKA